MNIIRFTTINSTNKYAQENLGNLADRTIIVSDEQTGGRGRLDRKWLSPAGVNIYCSIVLKNLTDKPALLTILAALAAAETIRKYEIPAQLKWPNDVLVSGKKICGVLAASTVGAAGTSGIVVGFGVNVNMNTELLKNIDQPATSMFEVTGQKFDREKILDEILKNFFSFYEHVLASGFASLLKIWQNELNIIGKKVQVKTVQKTFYGTVSQIDDGGALMVETIQGREKVLAGDVHVV